MRITAVETVRPHVQPNLLFVRLHTDDGRVGLGEAFFGAQTVESYLHESVAEVLLATEDPTPEAMAQKLERCRRSWTGASVPPRRPATV
jgi:galactonate dehydratase